MNTTKFQGNPVTLKGDFININKGDRAPEVKVVKNDLSEKTIGGAKDKVQIIAFVPSLDTDVCATETRKFNQRVTELGDVDFTIVSMDLPFAQKRFCTTEGIDKLDVTSDYRNKEASEKYGVLISDSPLQGLSARAIFVVGKCGKIAYKQIVPEITAEPDYDEVIEAVKNALNH